MVVAILLSVSALAACLAAWVAGVRWYYRLRTTPAARLAAVCSDGWQLGVVHRPAAVRRFREPVVLCHGLAANRMNFDFEPPFSLAHFLAEAGFECFVVDWRGTGLSRRPPRGVGRWQYSIDDHIAKDAPALIELALRQSGAKRAFWVGHSLGGLIGSAAAGGAVRGKLQGLVTIGSPAFFQYSWWLRRAVHTGLYLSLTGALHHRLVGTAIAPFLGYVALPLSDVIVNPKHIPPRIQRQVYANMMSSISLRVLRQLHDWIEHDAFRSEDRSVDYRDAIRSLDVPLLVMGGSADKLATPAAVRAQYELAGSADKTLIILGPENGDALEYGHGDVVFGSGAPSEVYPVIRRWLEGRATAAAGTHSDPAASA